MRMSAPNALASLIRRLSTAAITCEACWLAAVCSWVDPQRRFTAAASTQANQTRERSSVNLTKESAIRKGAAVVGYET